MSEEALQIAEKRSERQRIKGNQNLLGDIQEPRMICEHFSTKFNLWFTGANAERKICTMPFTLSDKNKHTFAWRD